MLERKTKNKNDNDGSYSEPASKRSRIDDEKALKGEDGGKIPGLILEQSPKLGVEESAKVEVSLEEAKKEGSDLIGKEEQNKGVESGAKAEEPPGVSQNGLQARSSGSETSADAGVSPFSALLAAEEECFDGPGLMTLSDDVLLYILGLVGPSDLLSLAACCERLRNIAKDKSLWRICDLRPRILPLNRLHNVLFWLQPVTSVFASCGPVEIMSSPREGDVVEPTWLLSFMILLCKYAPNLKTLIIENHIIDCTKIMIEDFPPSIENLTLKNCIFKNVPKQSSYFIGIHSSLTRLKSLDLTDSSWFVPHSLLALSKCDSLEELVLDGCDVSECMPYASLAANYGFHNLRLLDLRNTAVSDVEVSCFNKMASLRHLYISASEEMPTLFIVSYVTDLSITSFGDSPCAPRQLLGRRGLPPLVQIPGRPPCLLETLLLNNYRGITDITLHHAAIAMPHLKVLDVVNTNVTPQGLAKFKAQRPLVTLISSKEPATVSSRNPDSPTSSPESSTSSHESSTSCVESSTSSESS